MGLTTTNALSDVWKTSQTGDASVDNLLPRAVSQSASQPYLLGLLICKHQYQWLMC